MNAPNPRAGPSRAQWLRRLASRRRDRVAFVFSGGGPLGALQVGALRALFEYGLRPDLAVGTSVGAMNATFVAMEPSLPGVLRLEDLWRNLGDDDLFPGSRLRRSWARMFVKGNHVIPNDGIRRVLETKLPAPRFEDAQIPLGVIATDLETGAEEVFTSGELVRPLLASTAMPGIFPPVAIGDRTFIDGGVSNNVPIAPAIALGANTIYVLNSTSHSLQRRPLARPFDYLLHAFSLARSQRVALEQTLYAERVRLVILPAVPLSFYVPFASMAHTEELITSAYEHTKRFLSGGTDTVVESLQGGAVEAIVPAE